MERMAGQGGCRVATKCKFLFFEKILKSEIFGRQACSKSLNVRMLKVEIFGRCWKKYVVTVVSPNAQNLKIFKS